MNKIYKVYFDDISNIPTLIKDNFDYDITDLEKCDFIISCKFPRGIDKYDLIQNTITSYKEYNKKVLIFLISDVNEPYDIPSNVYIFRTSLYKTKKMYNETLLPFMWEPIEKDVYPLVKSDKPIVGFCGYLHKNPAYRKKLIDEMRRNTDKIICNFIIHFKFWGGKPNDTKLKNDFENNVINSHFTICNRGAGNFSMRFYQVLSVGRIPVLVDFDQLLPFEDEINWDDIIVRGKTEKEVIDKLLLLWNTRDIVEIQKKCKQVYDDYLCEKKCLRLLLNKFI